MVITKRHLIGAAILLIFFAGCGAKSPSQLEREKRMQDSKQYRDGKFKNPIDVPLMAPGSTWQYIKKSFFTKRTDPRPAGDMPLNPIRQADWIGMDSDSSMFAWLGHSSILMALDGMTVLVDPVLENRASPFAWFGPKRFHPAPVTAAGLPPIDVVLITHDHYDHLEAPTIKYLADRAGMFLMPLGIGQLLEKWGVKPEKIVELDWWQNQQSGSLTIWATPALHYARRGLFDGDKRLWCSWSIQSKNKKIFISGDSGYFDAFKHVGEKLGPFDLTFLKIGSYDEMWKQIHMTPESAVQQHRDLLGGVMVPLHWATFDLALHPWYEPIERVLTSAGDDDVHILTPMIGQLMDLNQLPGMHDWWRHVDNSVE